MDVSWEVDTVVCRVVCAGGLGGEEKINQLDLWAQKRERIQNIVEVRQN